MMTSDSADGRLTDSKVASFLGLSSELLDSVAHFLPHADLSSLSRTCKTLHYRLLCALYSNIRLRIPTRWSRLRSLEQLLMSSGDGLLYTRSIEILPSQGPLDPSLRTFEHSVEAENLEQTESDAVYLPTSVASSNLNSLMRLLIAKLPRQQVQSFHWDHNFILDQSTVTLLFKQHGGSLDSLGFIRYNTIPYCIPSDGELIVEGLTTLRTGGNNFHVGAEWVMALVAKNRRTLHRLQLGDEPQVATMTYDTFPTEEDAMIADTDFAAAAGWVDVQTHSRDMKLDWLEFCGLHLSPILDSKVSGNIGQAIDWSRLTTLSLQSCVGLGAAFKLLLDAKHNVRSLRSLSLRHEDGGVEFQCDFETFLTGLPPLRDLHVLVFGSPSHQELGPLLKVHGPTLRTFFWDEMASDIHTVFPPDLGHLATVSQYCPKLLALGLSWDWSVCCAPPGFKEKLAWDWSKGQSAPNADAFKRAMETLPKLETLYIRNPPELLLSLDLNVDHLFVGLASQIFESLSSSQSKDRPSAVKTIGFGTPKYCEVRTGTYHLGNMRELQRLHIYHLQSGEPKLVAKGVCDDAEGVCGDLSVFRPFRF